MLRYLNHYNKVSIYKKQDIILSVLILSKSPYLKLEQNKGPMLYVRPYINAHLFPSKLTAYLHNNKFAKSLQKFNDIQSFQSLYTYLSTLSFFSFLTHSQYVHSLSLSLSLFSSSFYIFIFCNHGFRIATLKMFPTQPLCTLSE